MKMSTYLALFPVVFFILSFINIVFALLALLCFTIPFIMLFKTKRKVWCSNYCPRGNFLTLLFNGRRKKGRTAPKWLHSNGMRSFMVSYFIINITMVIMSTTMVSLGKVDPIEQVRFMILLGIPGQLPQLINLAGVQPWIVHLSYRMFSMMFTTTTIAVLIGYLFKPRSWCAICPVNTLSNSYVKYQKNKAKV